MTDRLAVLIGCDRYDHSPDLRGAVHDVVALASRLLDRGVSPDNIRILTSPVLAADVLPGVSRGHATAAEIRRTLAEIATTTTDDDTVLIQVSARGLTTDDGPAILCADGDPTGGSALVQIDELAAPFRHLPVRSVLTMLDVGFGGGSDVTRTVAQPTAQADVSPTDPVVFANGLRGPVFELELDGQHRGALSFALCRCLDVLDPDCDWTFAQLLHAMRQVQAGLPHGEAAVMLPATDTFKPVGALLGGSQHVPWRGVSASWQWIPTHDYQGNVPGFCAGNDSEQWNFGGGAPFPGGQFTTMMMDGPGTPYAGQGVYTFSNQPFDTGTTVGAPGIGQADRAYQVTSSGNLGGNVYVVIRDAANPQSAEWYTTANTDFLNAGDNQSLTFTEIQSVPQGSYFTVAQHPM